MKIPEKYKNICIRTQTYNQLLKQGTLEDTFDSVISKLLLISKKYFEEKEQSKCK